MCVSRLGDGAVRFVRVMGGGLGMLGPTIAGGLFVSTSSSFL